MAKKAAFESLEMECILPALPAEIYTAWLNGEMHEEMTGGGGATASTKEGDAFTAWDGYISGTNKELVKNVRIVQNWRTTEFSEDDEDSLLEITLIPDGKKTRLKLVHTHIPAGQGAAYQKGWQDYYFDPMQEYFS